MHLFGFCFVCSSAVCIKDYSSFMELPYSLVKDQLVVYLCLYFCALLMFPSLPEHRGVILAFISPFETDLLYTPD